MAFAELRDIRPRRAVDGSVGGVAADAVLRGDFGDPSASRPQGAHLPDSVLGQLIATRGSTAAVNLRRAPLRCHVGHVVLRRPQEQVGGIHAWRVVAAVADEQAGRNRPNEQLVRDPMRLSRELVPSSASDIYGAVAAIEPASSPNPAFAGAAAQCFRVESLNQRHRLAHWQSVPPKTDQRRN